MSDGSNFREIRTQGSVYFDSSGTGSLTDYGVRVVAWERGDGRNTAVRMTEEEGGILISTYAQDDNKPASTTLVPWGNVRCATYSTSTSPSQERNMHKDAPPRGPQSLSALPPQEGQQHAARSTQAVMDEASGAAEAHRQDIADQREAALEKGKAVAQAAAEVDAKHEEKPPEAKKAETLHQQAKGKGK